VDLWAGHADEKRTRPWERDTIVIVFSTTKIAMIMAFLMLVDRGLVDLDAPVASYWPAFAAGGKHRVTVREALTHRGAVPGFEPPVQFAALHDWDAITAHIAAQPHWYGGRTVLCYHAMTYGFVLGEIMRRVDGRRPAQFFREELAQPAGIDLQLSLRSPIELARVADQVVLTPPGALLDIEDPLANRAWNSVAIADGDWSTWAGQTADIPSGNGHTNARGIARLCSIGALGGTLDGHRYLSKEIITEASSLQVDDTDPYVGPIRLGLGFGLHSDGYPAPTPTCFHWGGYGGSFGIMDQATGLSCGYAMNNLVVPDEYLGDRRMTRIWQTLGSVMRSL
jgi:CubicO group peptidase (beta-lactamase class C family)